MGMATEYSETLGCRIRELRIKQNLGLRELASKAEVSPSYLSEIESGESEPTVSKMQRIAKALGVSMTRILPT